MIKINDYEVKNSPEEMTVKEWEVVSRLLEKKTETGIDYFNKWCDVFEAVGLPEELWEEFDAASFNKAVREFNDVPKFDFELQKEVEIDGYTYRAYEDEFKLTVKDLRFIEKKIASKSKEVMAYVVSVIFKRTDLTKTEHYDNAHLKEKERLFSKLPAAVAVPYVQHIGRELANAMKDGE